MTHYSRTSWKARPPRAQYKLDEDQVIGLALHWPATEARLHTVEQVFGALRSWQNYHMDAKGWSDIAYQLAVDQAGNSYVLRGHRHRSGANGNQDLNERYGAILLVLAEGEQPTTEMLETTRNQIARHRHIFKHSTKIVGHGAIRPGGTACPGPIVNALIRAGRFEPVDAKHKEHV